MNLFSNSSEKYTEQQLLNTREVYIPQRFRKRIRTHIVGNLLDIADYPLIMCIVGSPGVGKSWQLRRCLEDEKIEVFSIDAAKLEDEIAGEPAKYIERTYLEAGACIRNGKLSAMVIDDFDTTVGEWEQNTGTVNHQAILAFLMHIAESSTYIDSIGDVNRVPIFITANHEKRIYDPLMRYGRTDIFRWIPKIDERAAIISSILDIEASLAMDLAQKYEQEPLSFFSHLYAMERVFLLEGIIGDRALSPMIKSDNDIRLLRSRLFNLKRETDWAMAAARFIER